MAKKFNPKLLNEELKKFRLLSEYSFYTEEPKQDDDLILGSHLGEADEDPNTDPNAAPADPNAAPATPAAPVDPNAAPAPAPADDSKTAANAAPADAGVPDGGPDVTAPDATAPEGDENLFGTDDGGLGGMEDDGGDEVEVDVTQLVKTGEEATNAASDASQKTSELLDKFNDLEQRVSSMNSLTHKIDALEKEIIKRNPTPVEKLEMRSMDSFPYNIKLTDYWKDVDGYEPTGSGTEQKQEYVLTQDDVDSGFTDASIKKTFDVPEDYEEEDVYD